MNRLRPSATAGAPGSVAPMISKSPPTRCARYQVDGSRVPRCGSLARSGFPVVVIVPSTTQLFEPMPSVVDELRTENRELRTEKAALSEELATTEDTEDTEEVLYGFPSVSPVSSA